MNSRWLAITLTALCTQSWAQRIETVHLIVPLQMTEPLLGDYSRVRSRKWFGLYCEGNKCAIKPTRVAVTIVRARNCDGKAVTASRVNYRPRRPLFVIDANMGRRDSIVRLDRNDTTAELNLDAPVATDAMSGGKVWSLTAGGRTYKASFPEAYSSDGTTCPNKGRLPITVTSAGVTETTWRRDICSLTALDIPDEFNIAWAGDLDSDGKLDMLISTPQGVFMLLVSSTPAARFQFSPRFPNKPAC